MQISDASKNGENEQENGLPPWKRALDLALILLLLPGLALIAIFLSLLIKAGSKGPILFKQTRVGYKGNLFTCYKFRTMQNNAEVHSHREHTTELIRSQAPMTKLDVRRDARLVPVGSLMRATGLDELPQLLNVLKREMSIVGPRPCIPYEYELYEPSQRHRLDAVPGLTGLWQVSGKNRTTFPQMVALDIEYSRRRSLAMDIKILTLTFPAIFQQCWDTKISTRKARTMPTEMRKSATIYHL